MTRKWIGMVLVLCAAIFVLADVAAAEINADYGAAFRLRHEYWGNMTDLNTKGQADRDFFRLRSSVWGKVDLNPDLGAYLKLTNEMKYYLGSYKPFLTSDSTSDNNPYDIDELFIDNLYFEAKNIFTLPFDLKIGRQDLMYGEGFLVQEGTPGDGSRSFYFNAAKGTIRFGKDYSLDLVYISDTRTDDYLPSLYPDRSASLALYDGSKKLLNASDETAFIAYGKAKLGSAVSVEPYYIYKEEDPTLTSHNTSGMSSKLKLNTVGMRFVLAMDNWKVRAEYAHQFGEYDDGLDRTGNGGYIFGGQKLESLLLKPEWEIGVVYLSGDDPKTSKREGWDPLFSRCPYWNELYIYTLTAENTRDAGPIPGYWSNMYLYKASVKLTFDPATTLALSYQYLRSDQPTSGLSAAMFSNSGKERGQLGTLMLYHAFTKRIDGIIQLEYFVPGNFYTDAAQNAFFSRVQLQFKF